MAILKVRDDNGNVFEIPAIVGAKGEKGADGYTPVKGVDYFTESEKQEVAREAAALVDVDVDTSDFISKSTEEHQAISSSLGVKGNLSAVSHDSQDERIEYGYDEIACYTGGTEYIYSLPDESGTLATREWVQQNAGGLKLTYLGDFATGTPNINPNDYIGFAYRIGVDYDWGMGFDVVKSGILFFENLDEYAYGGGVYFPFTTSDLYQAGIMIDPYGNGANANEKVVIQMSPNADWTSYEITFNPFLGASVDTSLGNGRVFVKILGIKA